MVLDISSKHIKEHVKVIKGVLKNLGAEKIPIIFVLNKVDLISEESDIISISKDYKGSVIISAKRHLMLSKLKKVIIKKMEENYQTLEIQLPYSEEEPFLKLKTH